jgi:hypothetical protein
LAVPFAEFTSYLSMQRLLLLLLQNALDENEGNDELENEGLKDCALAAPPNHIHDPSIANTNATLDPILRAKAPKRPPTTGLVTIFVPAYWTERS